MAYSVADNKSSKNKSDQFYYNIDKTVKNVQFNNFSKSINISIY